MNDAEFIAKIRSACHVLDAASLARCIKELHGYHNVLHFLGCLNMVRDELRTPVPIDVMMMVASKWVLSHQEPDTASDAIVNAILGAWLPADAPMDLDTYSRLASQYFGKIDDDRLRHWRLLK